MSRLLTGRKNIILDYSYINDRNILPLLSESFYLHSQNSTEINYLYDYYKGKQDIQNKTKETREDINNKITENRAYEIVTFKKGYMFGEPVQYISRGTDEVITDAIAELNNYMLLNHKGKLDNDLIEWVLIGGVGYRLVLPNKDYFGIDDPPFVARTLDPRYTYLIRSNDLDNSVLAGVTYTKSKQQIVTYYVYTKDKYYVITDGLVVETLPNPLGLIPIVEYTSGNARLGSFEIVLPLLDCLNKIKSLSVDDIEQAVNSILAIFGGDMDEDTYKKLQEWHTLVLPDGTDAKFIDGTINQNGSLSLSEYVYDAILSICGMPTQGSGNVNNTSGQAVIYRDGWNTAETQAKNLEGEFKYSETEFLKLVLKIIREIAKTPLRLVDIDIKFGRRYADNILTKVQALNQLLTCGIKPEIAIATCGIWNDPLDVAIQSKEYLDNTWSLDNKEDDELDVSVH